jgi:hypothetical protein
MSSNEKNFILYVARSFEVETEDLICEPLPLRLLAFYVELRVGRIRLVDEPKVCGHLFNARPVNVVPGSSNHGENAYKVECRSIGRIVVLEKVS